VKVGEVEHEVLCRYEESGLPHEDAQDKDDCRLRINGATGYPG